MEAESWKNLKLAAIDNLRVDSGYNAKYAALTFQGPPLDGERAARVCENLRQLLQEEIPSIRLWLRNESSVEEAPFLPAEPFFELLRQKRKKHRVSELQFHFEIKAVDEEEASLQACKSEDVSVSSTVWVNPLYDPEDDELHTTEVEQPGGGEAAMIRDCVLEARRIKAQESLTSAKPVLVFDEDRDPLNWIGPKVVDEYKSCALM